MAPPLRLTVLLAALAATSVASPDLSAQGCLASLATSGCRTECLAATASCFASPVCSTGNFTVAQASASAQSEATTATHLLSDTFVTCCLGCPSTPAAALAAQAALGVDLPCAACATEEQACADEPTCLYLRQFPLPSAAYNATAFPVHERYRSCIQTCTEPSMGSKFCSADTAVKRELPETIVFRVSFAQFIPNATEVEAFLSALNDSLVANGLAPPSIHCLELQDVNGEINALVTLLAGDDVALLRSLLTEMAIQFLFRGVLMIGFPSAQAVGNRQQPIGIFSGAGAVVVVILVVMGLKRAIKKRRAGNRLERSTASRRRLDPDGEADATNGDEVFGLDAEELQLTPIGSFIKQEEPLSPSSSSSALGSEHSERSVPRKSRKRKMSKREQDARASELTALRNDTGLLHAKATELEQQRTQMLERLIAQTSGGAGEDDNNRVAMVHLAVVENDMERLRDLLQDARVATRVGSPLSTQLVASPESAGSELISSSELPGFALAPPDEAMEVMEGEASEGLMLSESRLGVGGGLGAASVFGSEYMSVASPTSTNLSESIASETGQALRETVAIKRLVDAQDEAFGNSSLMWAVGHSHPDTFDQLLDLGASVMTRNNCGMTCLHLACIQGASAHVIRRLLEGGAPVAVEDEAGMTPLAYACMSGHELATTTLLAHSPEWCRLPGRSPLLCATKMGQHDSATALLSVPNVPPPALNASDETGKTSVHWAAATGDTSILETIIALQGRSLWLNADEHGNTPLHLACRESHLEVVELLLDAPRRLQLHANDRGMTPFHFAVQHDATDILAALCASQRPEVMVMFQQQEPELEEAKVATFIHGVDLPAYARTLGHSHCAHRLEQARRSSISC